MNTSERIKLIRQDSGLSQQKFASRLGMSRDVIKNIELNLVEPKEYVIKAICREFKINYLWLTKGEGDQCTLTPEDIFDEIRKEFDLSENDVELLRLYCELSKQERSELINYITAIINVRKGMQNEH